MSSNDDRSRARTWGSLLVMAALTLAACQAPAASPSPAESATPAASPSVAGESPTAPADATYESWINTVASTDPVRVRIVHWFDPANPAEHNQELIDRATAEWKKRYPNGQISWELVGWGEIDQKTPGFVQAGEDVDITYNWGGATENWCAAGFLVPIEQYMPAWWKATRIPEMFKLPANTLCPDGTLVMAAVGVESQFYLVRKDLADAAGVTAASMATYQGFVEGFKKISEQTAVKKPVGMALGADWTTMDMLSFLWLGNGLRFGDFRPDGSERDAWIEAATFIRDLFQYVPEAALSWYHDDLAQAYVSGAIAGRQVGNWDYANLATLDPSGSAFSEAKALMVPYPSGSKGPGAFHTSSYTGLFMLSTSPMERRQAAADLMAIVTETRTVWKHSDGTNPPTTDWTAEDRLKVAYDKNIGWWWKGMEQLNKSTATVPYQGFKARDEITALAYPHVVDLFRGKITPEELYEKVRAGALPLLSSN
jgi:ABC-type glycerol-3-phosphate transport system substrate-binding protein